MNWTGGALSRSRNAKSKVSLSVKQKNHFAKARLKLQNPQRPSPPAIQFFELGEWKPESGGHNDRRSNPVKQKVSGQRTLEQFENVQGVVRKLKSLRPRNQGKERKRSVINDTEGHVLPSGIPIPPVSPTSISSRLPSSSSPIQAEPTPKRNSKRLRTATPSTSDELDPLTAPDSVEAKRRKLLQESDWVGIERQRRLSRPVKMTFTAAKDRDLIGRRRRLTHSAIENRGKGQHPRPMKIPLMASHSEKPRGLHRRLPDEYWGADSLSIRIGPKATTEGPISDEILDCYQSSELSQRSSNSVKPLHYDNAGVVSRPQHQRRGIATSSVFREESSKPFRSHFSPEKVEQSGIAQFIEAATIPNDDNLSVAESELQLPENYHFPEPKPGFRLVFEQTPRPRGQTSEINVCSSLIVRDFAFDKGKFSGAVIEQPASLENRDVLEEQIPKIGPVEDENPSTSPLSFATSRYMQELESQSFGSGGRRVSVENMTNKAATANARPAVPGNKAEELRETTSDREPRTSGKLDEVQDKGQVQPAEDGDEIWQNSINVDFNDGFRTMPEQPTRTYISHATTARASVHEKRIPDEAPPKPIAQKSPMSSPDDDELLWRNFIFSDSDPNDHEWVIQEVSSPVESPPDTRISTYNPARTQPSMVAEVATSPLKQHPHLMDETMLDDSFVALDDDDASRYATASTSSTGSPGILTGNLSSMPQQDLSYPSDSPFQSSRLQVTSSPAPHDSQNHSSSNLPLPNNRNPRLPNPSSQIAKATSSVPPHTLPYLSPTGATYNPSSDELAWTPSRLPGPPTSKEKVVFKKPSRYVGERANDSPEPVHLGRNVSVSKKRRKKPTLAEAVERAKGRLGGKGRGRGRDYRRDERYGSEVVDEMEGTDQDDIVDD